jgi:hypothetical protein
MVRRGHEVHVFGPQIADAENVRKKFGVRCIRSPPGKWAATPGSAISNISRIRFSSNAWLPPPRATKFDLLLSQHAISAVAAGKLKRRLGVPVVMNFPDLLTGFMETWPATSRPSRSSTR